MFEKSTAPQYLQDLLKEIVVPEVFCRRPECHRAAIAYEWYCYQHMPKSLPGLARYRKAKFAELDGKKQ